MRSVTQNCNFWCFQVKFGIWYFWELKRNLTKLCRFPKSWVINRSLKYIFVSIFAWHRDKKKSVPCDVGMYISCSCLRQRIATGNSIHRLYQLLLCISKTETKTLEHKHLTLVHTTTVTSEDSRKSQLLFGLHITEMKESRKKHSLRAAFYNSNHWFFVFFVIFRSVKT